MFSIINESRKKRFPWRREMSLWLQINNWDVNEPKTSFRWLLMYLKDVVNELSCIQEPHSWRQGHNRLSMDDLPLMNHREWSVKSCPLRPSAITHGLYSYPNCINVMCLTLPPLFCKLFFFLPPPNKRPNSFMSSAWPLGRSPEASRSRSLSSEDKTGLCNSAQTWGGVWSVWSTTVVPGKDLNRFITKASCGVVCAAVSECVRASVCACVVCVCVHLYEVERRGEERRGEEGVYALPFPRERARRKNFAPFFSPWLVFRHERRDLRFIQRHDIHGFIL